MCIKIDRYLDFNFHHPVCHKRSVVSTLLCRAQNIPSTQIEKYDETKWVKAVLRDNNWMSWCKTDLSDFFSWFFSFKSAWIFAYPFQWSNKTLPCIFLRESTKHGPLVHGPPPWTGFMDQVHQNINQVHGPPFMEWVHGPPIFTSWGCTINYDLMTCCVTAPLSVNHAQV